MIDADTLDVGKVRVRLHGIDAPEIAQPCNRPEGGTWACGKWARDEARRRYQGQVATCRKTDMDRHGRTVAVCHVAGRDIGAEMVRDGLAEAYRKFSLDYVDAEKAAFFEGLGLWRGRVQEPAAFRALQSAESVQLPPGECKIKGNVSANGQIYHMPGQADYTKTRINERGGERWFCSESQARSAGWRRAKR